MNKRDFITGALALPALAAHAAPGARMYSGPGLLTICGDVGRTNRGPLDPALDQMMVKHGLHFTRGFVFDTAALHGLPTVSIHPTLEYDGKRHLLSGPLLTTVLEAAGVAGTGTMQVGLHAVDGYRVELPLPQLRRDRMIVATHMDGRPLALGGLGPQWAVHEADSLPEFRDKPLNER